MTTLQPLRSRALRANLKFALALAILILLPAWPLRYWQGWLLWLHICAWCFGLTLHFLKRDPALVERRMQAGARAEQLASQKRIQSVNGAGVITLLVLSALDAGFGWSSMSFAGIIIGHGLVALGFLIVATALRENSLAAATVAIVEGQPVVSTGPYTWIRHPMYAGAVILLIGIPLALGSWWGLTVLPPLLAGLVARLTDEERHLAAHLAGYAHYRRRVRHRLVPGLW